MADVVLITGVSRHLGGVYARRISEDSSVGRIIGVDVVPPPHDTGRAEFVRADIRSPMIGRIIGDAGVDTVVHMSVIATPLHAGGRVPQKEINVIGTMQLLAACQKAPTLRRLVVKSSSAVYGASARDPALFTEDMEAKVLPRTGYGKDSVEVEGYVRGFARRRPDVDIAMLRFANVIGPDIRTAFTDYFSLPVIPVPFGFDARLQFVHETDTIAALVRATTGDPVGTVNVAGDGVITVCQAAAMTGRPVIPMPRPATGPVNQVLRSAGLIDLPHDQVAFLTYGRGLDTRRMRADMGFEPRFTTRAAFEDFAEQVRGPAQHLGSVGLDVAGRIGGLLARATHGMGE